MHFEVLITLAHKILTVRQTWHLPRGSSFQTQNTKVLFLLGGADTARERHGSDKERESLDAHTGATDDVFVFVFIHIGGSSARVIDQRTPKRGKLNARG